VSTVRDDTATTTCALCGMGFERLGRQRFCSSICRKAAWRRQRSAPVEPIVAKADTVFECPQCDSRYLGDQRCPDCNTFARRIGPGGLCPCCDEIIAMTDLFSDNQLARPNSRPRRR